MNITDPYPWATGVTFAPLSQGNGISSTRIFRAIPGTPPPASARPVPSRRRGRKGPANAQKCRPQNKL
ncbi:hypothetical protein CPHO_02185 [Corynebacterium phocae]|uniref:Uncharacterized protein n=1 Tax=Corynebacterium phocae TaxID=161895 RepID=A0A1L7D1H4_9CORY|nr:hypothetical protein CPHO_02185 [Corynebacterium phocae]